MIGLKTTLGKRQNTNKTKNEGKAKYVTKQMVKSMIAAPAELKHFDQSLQLGAVVGGNIYNISDITRGTDVTQRVGNEVYLKEVRVRLSFSINSAVDKAMIRYIFLIDTMGANAPVVTDVLEAGLVGTSYTDICPYYWDYRKRFRILKDEVVPLNKYSSNGYTFRAFDLPLNVKSYNIGAATTFKNHLYVLLIGSELNVLNISSVQYHTRLLFTDD